MVTLLANVDNNNKFRTPRILDTDVVQIVVPSIINPTTTVQTLDEIFDPTDWNMLWA